MQNFIFKALIGGLAFLSGIGAVALAEAFVQSFVLGDEPVVEKQFSWDPHRWKADYVLSTKVDFHVKGVRPGTTESELLRLLGKPKRLVPDSVNYDVELQQYRDYDYDGMTVGLSKSQGRFLVDIIEIESAQWSYQGLRVGSSVHEIKQVLGNPLSETKNFMSYHGIEKSSSVEFHLENEVIVSIKVGFGRC